MKEACINLNSFLQSQQSVSYLVETLLPNGHIALLASDPGAGKSFVTCALSIHVAYGVPFLGQAVKKSAVVIIDADNPRDVLADRLRRIDCGVHHWCSDQGVSVPQREQIEVLSWPNLRLDRTTGNSLVENRMRSINAGLLIIDHYGQFHHQNENSATQMERVANGLERLRQVCQATILAVHHFGKAKGTFARRLRGSTAILARTEVAFECRALQIDRGSLKLIGLIPQQRKIVTPPPLKIKLVEGDDWIRLEPAGAALTAAEDPQLDNLAHSIFHLFFEEPAQRTVEEVGERLGGLASIRETRDTLWWLQEKGLLQLTREAHNKYVFELHENAPTLCLWCNAENKNTEKLEN